MRYKKLVILIIGIFAVFSLHSFTAIKIHREIIPDAICDLKVTPAKANLNDPISVDMSGSQFAKSMEVEIFDIAGNLVTSRVLMPESPQWKTSFDKPGEYTFKGKALNLEGELSENLCEAKVYINFPPTCRLWTSCLPCDDYVDKVIVFDGSGSTDPDGEIVRANFEIVDEAGDVVDKKVITERPFTWEKVFREPGVYTVILIVTDDFGALSEICRLTIEVTKKRFFILGSGGLFLAKDGQEDNYGPYLAVRVGLLYKLIPNTLSFILSGGGGIALKGHPWKNVLTLNALLNLHAGPIFFGGGAGLTTEVKEARNTDAELVLNSGFDLFDTQTSIVSIFGEVRIPVGEDREFSKHHKLMFGLRFLF
ncbi:MAG: PKD domain-containing protein [Candidatus Aminicenantaceae bacterium]